MTPDKLDQIIETFPHALLSAEGAVAYGDLIADTQTAEEVARTPKKWALAQLANGFNINHVGPTRSDLWTTITAWEFDSEQDAIDEAQAWLDGTMTEGGFDPEEPMYFATWQEDDDFVTTILGNEEAHP